MIKNKGFMLVETLVVTTLITTVLILLYAQFNKLASNFSKTFN
jgi:competence protein ComGC